MHKANSTETYARLLQLAIERFDGDGARALRYIVGDEFTAVGLLELQLLRHLGLKPWNYLIDVGCGSGRLTAALAGYLRGKYLGTDVLPELVECARSIADQPSWRFELVQDPRIPEEDEQADVICFFSVFTHMLHEQSFLYLREATRVLKPDGKIVFSFLDYSVPDHWKYFASSVSEFGEDTPLNVFISHNAIRAWARHLDLSVEDIFDSDYKFIPLASPIFFDSGLMIEGKAKFGQSVCVLRRS